MVSFMLPSPIEIEEYVDARERSPFKLWFDDLAPTQAVKVAFALDKIGRGAASNVKGVGGGVLEYRIDAGPGYRIYFGRDGERLVILLAGGTKRRQDADIAAAKSRWADYKARKTRAER